MKKQYKKAFEIYKVNKYWIVQLIALMFLTIVFQGADEFDSDLVLILSMAVLIAVILLPFLYILIWAKEFKDKENE